MKRIMIACVAVAAFAAPAFAAEPDGTFVLNTNTNSSGSYIGQASSAISQNGQFVSGNCGLECGAFGPNYDKTKSPGSRGDLVQGLQALQDRGRDKP
jgi:hypothetical protein